MLCLQVLPQLLAEVVGAEFHDHSPAGPQPSVNRTSPLVPPPRLPPSLQPLPPRRSLPPFLGRPRRHHFRLLVPLNYQHSGSSLPAVSQSEPGWRAAGHAAPFAHPPPASRRRTKSLCRFSRNLQDHRSVLFPKATFLQSWLPSPFRGPRTQKPPLTLDLQPRKSGWDMQQDRGASSESTCSTVRTLGIGAVFTWDSLSILLVGSGNTTRVAKKVAPGGPAGEDPGTWC
ncbi:GIY-YIG domain containing 2, isoform CRA_a [Rattus norvegicus]|uniref:GIY-YIG domain containing 2, isoform CRA_a n=1 Tax=Rattus norvegicus TaxID=10116 RepID=A6I9B5_RAT|nr:GIY-YIG domain containing 2, isoform CRA_a [Rattus norvegicus]EDM17416.1 GIY-YIG domain containing 2, isoform CRA_a [Rattus norvegicus]